jgi:hypothetical protein
MEGTFRRLVVVKGVLPLLLQDVNHRVQWRRNQQALRQRTEKHQLLEKPSAFMS